MKKNIKLVIMIIFILTFIIIIFYKKNKFKKVNHIAKPGQYSEHGKYLNMTPMKYDMLQQITVSLTIFITIFIFVEVLGGYDTFLEWSDFISFENLREFRLSIIGSSLLSCLGYALYYQIFVPYLFNYVPKF